MIDLEAARAVCDAARQPYKSPLCTCDSGIGCIYHEHLDTAKSQCVDLLPAALDEIAVLRESLGKLLHSVQVYMDAPGQIRGECMRDLEGTYRELTQPELIEKYGWPRIVQRLKSERDAAHQHLAYLWETTHSCPCGARKESMSTHPHVIGCPTEKATRE